MRASLSLGFVSWIAVAAVVFVGCGDDDGSGPEVDAGSDADTVIDGSAACTTDDECDDGVYCNGPEVCDDTVCKRGRAVDCDDNVECTQDVCSDSASSCRNLPPDFDGDGHADVSCESAGGDPLGDDCDDDNANRYPGNIEICDAEGLDEDCNASTVGNKDQDNDGAIDGRCCNPGTNGTPVCGTDCDDLKIAVNPSATEVCDLFDNDCNGETDEEGSVLLFPDTDFDGHGQTGSTAVARCAGTLGFSADDDDCDDTDPAVHRAQVEICDTKDNDCDETVDESPRSVFWYRDRDGDRFGGRLEAALFQCAPPDGYDLRDTDCDDETAAVNPGAAELCDGLDNNCDGAKSFSIGVNDFEDDDNDGSADFGCGVTGNDCDDNNSATGGTLLEICDKLDNDCDDKVDEDVADTVWYIDADGDGFGNERLPAVVYCSPLTGRSAYPGDCNDADVDVNPNAFEVCGLGLVSTGDEDCDGSVDETDDGFCPVCGDGRPDGPEQCDDRAVNSRGECVDPDGACNDDTLPDACRTDCRQAHCGDGVVDTGEDCDEGVDNSDAGNATCRPDCTLQRCGDGIVDDDTEACEVGVGADGDICTSACFFFGFAEAGCTTATPIDLGSAVGGVVVGGSTGTTNDITLGTADLCAFSTGSAPVGPEAVYRWSAPVTMHYALRVVSAPASRLTLAVFADGGVERPDCVEPHFACLEPPGAASFMLQDFPEGSPNAFVIDSTATQTFGLTINPLICCDHDVAPIDLPSTACADTLSELGTQADLDAVLAQRPACLGLWNAACVTEAMNQGLCTD